MYKVKLETGETINFETEPTQDDIEEAVSSLQPKQQPNFFQSTADVFVGGATNLLNTAQSYVGAGGTYLGQRLNNSETDNQTFSDILQNEQQLIEENQKKYSNLVFGRNAETRDLSTLKGLKQTAGDVISTGSNFVGGGLIKAGVVGGVGFGFGSALQQDKGLEDTITDTAIGGATGLGLGLLFKGAGTLISKGSPIVAKSAGALIRKVGGQTDTLASETQVGNKVFDNIEDATIKSNLNGEDVASYRYESPEIINNLAGLEKQQAIFAKTLKEEIVDNYSVLNKEITKASRQGNDIIGTTVKNGIIPDLIETAGKITQKYSDEAIKKLETIASDRFSILSKTLDKLDSTGIKAPTIDEIGFKALEEARLSGDVTDVSKVLKQVEEEIETLSQGFFEKRNPVNWKTLNEAKSKLYKNINWGSDNASIKSEAADAISTAIRKLTEEIAPETKQLNREVGSLLSARKFVEKFNNAGRIIPYGSRFADILYKGVASYNPATTLLKQVPLFDGLGPVIDNFLKNKGLQAYAKGRYLKGVNLEALKTSKYIPEIYGKIGVTDPAIIRDIMNTGKKYFGDEGVEILPNLLDGQLGKYEDEIIKLAGNRKDIIDTFNHEAIHKAIDKFLTVEEKLKLVDDATKRFGKIEIKQLEEKIAEEFVDYVKVKEGTSIFGKIINRIKSFIKNKDSITNLYERLRSGEFKSVKGTSTGNLEEVYKKSKLSKEEVVKLNQILKDDTLKTTSTSARIDTDSQGINDFAPDIPSPKEYYNFEERIKGFTDVREVQIAKNQVAKSLIETYDVYKELVKIERTSEGSYKQIIASEILELKDSINTGKTVYKRVGDEIFSRDKRIGSVEEKLDRLNSNDYNTKYDKNLDGNITGNRTSNKQGGSSISTSLPDGLNLGRLSENGKGQSIGTTKDLPKQRLSKDQQRILQKEGSLKLKNEEVEAIFGEEIYRIINDSLEKIVEIEPSIREIGNVVLYNTKDDIVKATGGLNVKASLTTGNGRWNINIKADEEIKDYIVRHEARHLEQLFVKDFNKEVVEGLSITDDVKPYIQQHMEVLDVYTGKKSKPVKTIEEALKETDRILKLSKIPKEKYNNEYKNILAIEQDALNAEAPKSKFLDKNRIFGKIDSREANLLEEAKKYKSAEEFVKAQGKEIYHGTDKVFKELDVTKTPDGSVWFTDNLDSIKKGESGASGTKRIINKFINENDLKLAGWDDYDNYSLDQLQEMGFDGVKLPENGKVDYQIFNIGKLKTKSQLEQIWKEANTT